MKTDDRPTQSLINPHSVSTVHHPLDPLSAEEITVATTLLRQSSIPESAFFISVSLLEPPKAEVLSYQLGEPMQRRVFVVFRDPIAQVVYEATVSLTNNCVETITAIPGVQPPITMYELLAFEDAVRADPRWQVAMQKRGIKDFSLACISPVPSGYFGEAENTLERGRFVRGITFMRSNPTGNQFARPVEGLLAIVNLDTLKVLEVQDHGITPLPPHPGDYIPELAMASPDNRAKVESLRDDVKPISITQPDGPSFTIAGNLVEWQKWSFRVGFTHREGLVLHQVGYRDQNRVRPILYRASLSEMFVCYGDANPTHFHKNVFDEGEAGIGMLANSLSLGCDCLGYIHYFDAVLCQPDGSPFVIQNAICLHEEDFGIAWKHTDQRAETVEVRRMRRLVISMIATLDNYEYGFFWYLYQDGTIECELKLTGIVSTGAIASGEPEFGVMIAPGLYAPNHQHHFCFRLDMTIDGVENSVYEVDSELLPIDDRNPYGNAWRLRPTLLTSESMAQRDANPQVARYWKVVNPNITNDFGQHPGYKLVPGESTPLYHQVGSPARERALFATHSLWVTEYDPKELWAAGDYPYQSQGGAGLPTYTQGDRALVNTDVVMWYTLNAHHVARPEDWPVMPVTRVGFCLKPVAFFDGNPALDLPRPKHACHN